MVSLATTTFASLEIPADSQWVWHTRAPNSAGSVGLLDDLTGELFTPTAPTPPGGATVFGTVLAKDGITVLMAQTQFTYQTTGKYAGHWLLVVPATVCQDSSGPVWIGKGEVHGPAGVGDTLLRTFWCALRQADSTR